MISKIGTFLIDLTVKVVLLTFFWTLFQTIRSVAGY
jgi:hypothetical protein